MRTKDPELMKQILEYIEDYYIDHNASPSTTQIAEQMGIARGTVHKYLVEMDERGMLSYQGRKITTERTEKMHTSTFRAAVVGDISCGLPNIAEEHIEEYVSLPESMFGRPHDISPTTAALKVDVCIFSVRSVVIFLP